MRRGTKTGTVPIANARRLGFVDSIASDHMFDRKFTCMDGFAERAKTADEQLFHYLSRR